MDRHSMHPGGESSASGAIHLLTTKYIKHSKSVSILWTVFSVCSAILNVVVFMQDEWVGDTPTSKSPGHFGLWRFCTVLSDGGEASEGSVKCVGSLDNFASILSPAFRAATVFVGLSVIVGIMVVVALLLFCFMKSRSVFEICGTMQLLCGICMCLGILCFPAGWDNDHVRGICGSESDNYVLGDCGVRWTFVLAVVAILDTWILGFLAFTLSHRHAQPIYMTRGMAESPYMNPGSIYKGEINGGFVGDGHSLAGSRKSLNVPPVVMLPHPSAGLPHFMHDGPPPPMFPPPPPPDVYSEFRNGGGRNVPLPYNPNRQGIQNFQL